MDKKEFMGIEDITEYDTKIKEYIDKKIDALKTRIETLESKVS